MADAEFTFHRTSLSGPSKAIEITRLSALASGPISQRVVATITTLRHPDTGVVTRDYDLQGTVSGFGCK